MMRFPFILMMSFALFSAGCEDEPDVDTTTSTPPAETDEDPQVSGYRGTPEQNEMDAQDPDSALIVVDPDPLDTPPADPQTDPFSDLGTPDQQPQGDQPPLTTTPQPGDTQQDDPAGEIEDPAVEEEPANELPETDASQGEGSGQGGGSGS